MQKFIAKTKLEWSVRIRYGGKCKNENRKKKRAYFEDEGNNSVFGHLIIDFRIMSSPKLPRRDIMKTKPGFRFFLSPQIEKAKITRKNNKAPIFSKEAKSFRQKMKKNPKRIAPIMLKTRIN